MKSETIADNINRTAEILHLDIKEFTLSVLKHPPLFCQKPETIAENINKTAELLSIAPEVYVQAALKLPQLFCQKPETMAKKVKIIQYYKQIQNKESDRMVIPTHSDGWLYENILNYLVRTADGRKFAIKKSEFIKYLKESREMYHFEIPANEVAKDFIKFALEFAEKNLGRQIFSFKIKI